MVVNQLFYTSTYNDQQGTSQYPQEPDSSEQPKRILVLADDDTVSRHAIQALDAQGYSVQHVSTLDTFGHLDLSHEVCTPPRETKTGADTIQPDWAVADIVVVSGGTAFLNAAGEFCRWHKEIAQAYVPVVLIDSVDQIETLIKESGIQPDVIVTLPLHTFVLTTQVASMLRIKHDRDALQGVTRLREDLTNMIAHDLRTPLTVITLYSAGVRRMLKQLRSTIDAPTVSKIHERIQTITDNVNVMESLIADMLTIARTEANNLTLRRSWMNINDLVVTACHPQREISRTKNIDLNITLLEHDIDIQLDRDLMRRVLDNLLANAIKFSPDGGQVDVKVEYTHDDCGICEGIRVCIKDQGPGIDESFQEHIFNRWGIAELKRQGVAQIGLGLAFCKLVVEAHDGQIVVESQPGQGSTFCFSLPL